jgi:citrate lyase subunit beta/citryl-CoA lyase
MRNFNKILKREEIRLVPYRGIRRSLLFVPGESERKFQHALKTAADGIILDLEDSVAAHLKPVARKQVNRLLKTSDFAGKERLVRINPLSSGLTEQDIEETIAGRPHTYVIPKVSVPEDIQQIDRILERNEDKYGFPLGSTGLLVIVAETPASMLYLREIAASSKRITGFTWGNEDLITALGGKKIRDDAGELIPLFHIVRSFALLTAVSFNIDPLDAVYANFKDLTGLSKEAQDAADLGYIGKIAIHPDQINPINRHFEISDEEIAEARELVEAFEVARANGQNTFAFKGGMVDEPHYTRAMKLLKRADRLKNRMKF